MKQRLESNKFHMLSCGHAKVRVQALECQVLGAGIGFSQIFTPPL